MNTQGALSQHPANILASRLGANSDREFSGNGYTGEVLNSHPEPTVAINIQAVSACKADAILAILNTPD